MERHAIEEWLHQYLCAFVDRRARPQPLVIAAIQSAPKHRIQTTDLRMTNGLTNFGLTASHRRRAQLAPKCRLTKSSIRYRLHFMNIKYFDPRTRSICWREDERHALLKRKDLWPVSPGASKVVATDSTLIWAKDCGAKNGTRRAVMMPNYVLIRFRCTLRSTLCRCYGATSLDPSRGRLHHQHQRHHCYV